ncbi:hypothetical protein AAF712_005242 [Marasmius tenuissimus]|uniref:F-box domain-containing protein n=1 Tax=Marasmius tenuissimus TaxID=585030 RepID=A0ABR3A1H7_9AGAR|nr:hypothetical protein PM082_022437 [Marasmius tenuissimus]
MMGQTYIAELLQASVDHVLFIEDRFGQRSPLSLCDQDAIAQSIPPIQSDILRLDDEITQLKTTLSLLESHRDRLNHSIEKGRWLAFPPPVCKLPSEVLASIFSFSLPFSDGYNRLSLDHKKHKLPVPIPMLVSVVCSSWRKTALSTSKLWSAISFEFNKSWSRRSEPDDILAKIEHLRWITELFITRARTSPLALRFYSGYSWPPAGDRTWGDINRALETLCQRSAQWFSVDFSIEWPRHSFPAIWQSIKGNLPNLHKLSACPAALPALTPIFADSCPALKAIELHSFRDEDFDAIGIRVPWHQVEDLRVSGAVVPRMFAIVELVSLCPNLTSFHYSYPNYAARSDNPANDAAANNLTSNMKTLSLPSSPGNDHHHAWVTFLDHFTLPRLSSLTLTAQLSGSRGECGDLSPLLQCISRSSCSITTLTIVTNNLTGAQYRELFSLMPWVTSLTVAPERGRPILELLDLLLVDNSTTDGETSQHLLPRLRNLVVTGYLYDLNSDQFERVFDRLYQVVKSRWTPSAAPQKSLRSVTIPVRPFSREETAIDRESPGLEKLRELGEQGLELFIKTDWYMT